MPRGAELPDDEGQRVLGRVLQDPRVAPAVLTALPARAQAGLAVASAVASSLALTDKRARTEGERAQSGTVAAACFNKDDTPRAIAAKAGVLGMERRRAKQAHAWKCAEPCFVPSSRKRRCDNKDGAVAVAYDWLHSDNVCPPRSADTRDLRVIPVGDGKALYTRGASVSSHWTPCTATSTGRAR